MTKTYTRAWKKLAQEAITSTDIVLLAALKAFFAKKTNETNREAIFQSIIRQAFTPVTNQKKIFNGMHEWKGLKHALTQAAWIAQSSRAMHSIVGFFNLTKEETLNEIFNGSKEDFLEFGKFLMDQKNLASQSDEGFEVFRRRNYTYIFVDQKNVEPIYQAVQAAHVAMVIGQKMDKRFDASQVHYQICALPKDDISVEEMAFYLCAEGFTVEEFYEPDVDRIIAIGTHPVPSHKRGVLKKFDLLTF